MTRASSSIEPALPQPVTCPCCWQTSAPEDLLFIAGHPDLVGDPVLGRDEPLRFLASRFTPDGTALDAGGMICTDRACPRCHLRLPANLPWQPPLFLSVIGAPGSGKSYFLASLLWKARTTLPAAFGLHFLDADPRLNGWVNAYEEKLFMATAPDAFQTLEKTHMQGALYQQVMLNGMPVRLPRPCLFALSRPPPAPHAPPARTLVFYDNAGEHFLPDGDRASDPGTQHLLHSEGIIFLVDPTKDPRLRALIGQPDPQLSETRPTQAQHNLLLVMQDVIRRHAGDGAGRRALPPLLVVLAKADLLADRLPDGFPQPPWEPGTAPGAATLNLATLTRLSGFIRELLLAHAPELVTTAESLTDSVFYLPHSALGHSPGEVPEHPGVLAVRPCDIRPLWAEVPLLYLLRQLGWLA